MSMNVTYQAVVELKIDEGKDRGLLAGLLRWQLANEIYPVFTPLSGNGQLHAYYLPEDATKVLEWLKRVGKILDELTEYDEVKE